jgi:hypothetical protein
VNVGKKTEINISNQWLVLSEKTIVILLYSLIPLAIIARFILKLAVLSTYAGLLEQPQSDSVILFRSLGCSFEQ